MGEPQFDADGDFIGYIGSTVDITEQRKDATELERTNEQLNRTAREITWLNELNDHLQVCKTIDETVPILKRYGGLLFPDASVSIGLISESRNVVEPFVSWGESATLNRMFSPHECWALRRGKPHIESPCESGSLCPNTKTCSIKFGYACIPMIAYGEVLGVMNVCFHNKGIEDETRGGLNSCLAKTTADQTALAIANLKLRETLQHQSTRDPLTQLYNRRFLLDNLDREVCRAKRDGNTVAVLMLDIDHFKRFNDTYGHEAGDIVLREVGSLLRQSVRSVDLPCRYGGEEFMIVLVDTDEASGIARAEDIRKKVSKLAIELGRKPLGNVTASIGLSFYPSDADTIEKMISTADQALYAAKAAGRNRVVEFRSMVSKGNETSSKVVSASALPHVGFGSNQGLSGIVN
ncbi:diguanylate cyclase (GGDEF)-like protein [Rhodopirellula rubra]|uniref:diguanylate cyclase n=2 Tax=Aporhodopirellula rubra TaxID=980271 RepID=A0A7W5H5V6_9BACT|nr:diguanylate cyclase (GGDEF)-like protein [Aporhodopirellula rubra]